MIRRVLFDKTRTQSTLLDERQSLNEPRVICAIARDCGRATCQTSCLTAICRNKSWKVETMVLQWMLTIGRNPEQRDCNLFSAILHVWRSSASIHNMRTRHSVVTGDTLNVADFT
jgi:hypothetical protein